MKILRAGDYKRMPWKNGGGETVEIAIFPPAATIDDFDWRVSMATVAEDGPFSMFEGIDRTLCVLSGNGIVISVEGSEDVELSPSSEPLDFPGDVITGARLLGGKVTDLNVMTNRHRKAHSVARVRFTGDILIPSEGILTLIALISPPALEWGCGRLEYLDALVLEPGDTVTLRSTMPTSILKIEIFER